MRVAPWPCVLSAMAAARSATPHLRWTTRLAALAHTGQFRLYLEAERPPDPLKRDSAVLPITRRATRSSPSPKGPRTASGMGSIGERTHTRHAAMTSMERTGSFRARGGSTVPALPAAGDCSANASRTEVGGGGGGRDERWLACNSGGYHLPSDACHQPGWCRGPPVSALISTLFCEYTCSTTTPAAGGRPSVVLRIVSQL